MDFKHGANAYSNRGCRCEVCTTGHRDRCREHRARRRAGLVDGRVVDPAIKHGAATYTNHGCRCEVCRSDWNTMLREHRKGPQRIGTHGESGYRRGCRCDTCRSANRERNRAYWARRREREAMG